MNVLSSFQALDRPEITHGVVYGLLANAAAFHLMRSIELILAAEKKRRQREGIRSSLEHALIRHSLAILLGFLSYYLIYALTGFVPMGFVSGAKPLIPFFKEH